MKKKLLPIILVCCMLSAWLAAYAHADDIVDRGDCGDNAHWSLNSAGMMSITGSGAMEDFGWHLFNGSRYSNSPWGTHNSSYLSMITSVTVGNGITVLGSHSFYGLDRLTKVTLPDSLIMVNDAAFYCCTSLTKITFPANITRIADYTFAGCSNLLSFTIPENVAGIGASAFEDCDRLTSIVIPAKVENVSVNAFTSCDRLQCVTILGDIPIIKAETFSDCPALTEITIPDSVMIIEENAFSGCDALTDVYFTGSESMWNEISVDGGNTPLENANIHFDTSVEATYRINSISISDMAGNPLTKIPNGVFLQTVSVTNRAFGGSPVIFVAAYAADGKFQNYAYVTVKEPVGGTVEVTLPVDNSKGNIAQLKAFAVKSFSGLEPIGNLVSFPAQ